MPGRNQSCKHHHSDVIMNPMASQIISVFIVCSAVCSGANQRKHQIFASLAFVRGIHRSPVNSPHKGPVTRKMFPYDDVILRWITIGFSQCPLVTQNHTFMIIFVMDFDNDQSSSVLGLVNVNPRINVDAKYISFVQRDILQSLSWMLLRTRCPHTNRSIMYSGRH